MSTRHNNGSHYENHQRTVELEDLGAHAHRFGELHGKPEHLTGHEHSRQALEYSESGRTQSAPIDRMLAVCEHSDIAALAHQLWKDRGCPEGSPQQDWFRAAEELRSHARR